MTKRRVQLFGQSRGIEIDTAATEGAVVGVNLRWQNGEIVTEEDLARAPTEDDYQVTFWRLIQEVPPNVQALASQAGTGMYVITGDGASATREILPADGETIVQNGNGVDDDPMIGLADVDVEEGGTLQKTAFDPKGRRTHEGAATTDDLPEGPGNLYFTEDRSLVASQKPVRVLGFINAFIRSSDRAKWIRFEGAKGNLILRSGGWEAGDEVSVHAVSTSPAILAAGISLTAKANRHLAAEYPGSVIHIKFSSPTEAHVYGDLSGSPPSLRLLAESGDFLVTESGDHLRV